MGYGSASGFKDKSATAEILCLCFLSPIVFGMEANANDNANANTNTNANEGKYHNCRLVLKGSFWFFLV